MTVFRPKLRKVIPSMERMYDIIVAPVVTEKSTDASEQNKIVFNVSSCATKSEIQIAIETLFGVKVKNVNTLVRKGKNVRFKGRPGSHSDVKRAIVTLNDGHSIDVTAGVVK